MAAPAVQVPPIPADDLLRACVHCGFCLPVCPTYQVLGSEADSPRGRLYFMRAVSEQTIPLTPHVREHLDRCLVCRACETACPAGVRFGALMERARAITNEVVRPPWWARALRRIMFGGVFPHPRRLQWLARAARVYQRSGLQRLVRASGLLRALPGEWAQREARLPPVPARGFRAGAATVHHPAGPPVAKVALFTGCVQDIVHGHVHAATVRVLVRYGCEVHVPAGQRCCGALQAHQGELEYARAQARANMGAFSPGDYDAIVNNAAGCGAALREMPAWFAPEDPWRERAGHLAERMRDVTEFLAGLSAPDDWRPVVRRVAYDDPCHLLHAQGRGQAPRELLARVPDLELVDVTDNDDCCGAAGIYTLTQPALSEAIGVKKIAAILQTRPDMVATGNPGCMMQIAAGLAAGGRSIPVVHPIELVDEALGGPRAGTGTPRV